MAERQGFEPWLGCPTIGFRNQPLQPLEYRSKNNYIKKFKIFLIILCFSSINSYLN